LLAEFPALSEAVTVRMFGPSVSEMPEADQEVVPVAVPLWPELLDHATCETALLSVAVPESEMVLVEVESVLPVVGEVIATTGAVVSGIV